MALTRRVGMRSWPRCGQYSLRRRQDCIPKWHLGTRNLGTRKKAKKKGKIKKKSSMPRKTKIAWVLLHYHPNPKYTAYGHYLSFWNSPPPCHRRKEIS